MSLWRTLAELWPSCGRWHYWLQLRAETPHRVASRRRYVRWILVSWKPTVGNGYWWSRQVSAVGRPSATGTADDWRTTSLGVTSHLRHLRPRRYITLSAPRQCFIDWLLRLTLFSFRIQTRFRQLRVFRSAHWTRVVKAFSVGLDIRAHVTWQLSETRCVIYHNKNKTVVCTCWFHS